MVWLIAGVILWMTVHLSSSVAPAARARAIERLGEGPYKGIYSLLLVASLVLIVVGWRSSEFIAIYTPPPWSRPVTIALMLPAFLLVVAADVPRNHLRQWLRHPMLTGAALWGAGHLLANGDARSLILFGGLGAWALLEMAFINRRDGPRVPPPVASTKMTLLWLATGTAVYLLLGWLHRWFAGVLIFG